MRAMKSFMTRFRTISIGSAMADMALLLLVFFMASTSTEPPSGVSLELPRARTQGAEQESIYITISREGDVYIDGRKTTTEDLQDSLAMRQSEKDRVVSITADKNLNYEVIAGVLSILRSQDFLNIVFMSESRKETGARE